VRRARPGLAIRTSAAPETKADLLVGRDSEIERIMDALSKREAPLPCLVGEPGVGKTAIGLALAVRDTLGRTVRRVDLRAERPPALAEEIAASAGETVFFLDGLEAAGDDPGLMALLARAEVPCLLAATPTGLRALYEAHPALERRLEVILVTEPDEALLVRVLARHGEVLGLHHGVKYDGAAIDAAARLGARHLAQRFLPDKAIALLDLAGARARRRGDRVCTAEHVVALIAEATGIPSPRLLLDDGERLLGLEADLGELVVGHTDALKRIADVVRRNYAGFRGKRPIGTFLFLGPTGVGKTETAKALAEILMGDERALVRLDMSEYAEAHSVARLVGAPPGYVGHEEGGQLSEPMRTRPYRVVLLDEIERAHRDVQELLLQLLDEARLTDGRGRTVDFSNAVVIMTSNLGAEAREPAIMLQSARRSMPIELWNRIEAPLAFVPLARSEVAEVARRLAKKASARLEAERGITFTLAEDAITFLLGNGGYDPELGARPMRSTLGRFVESELAEGILRGDITRGQRILVSVQAGALTFKPERTRVSRAS
jgi:ATP-dependent Clp protease ATP-binding subunit ClpC